MKVTDYRDAKQYLALHNNS